MNCLPLKIRNHYLPQPCYLNLRHHFISGENRYLTLRIPPEQARELLQRPAFEASIQDKFKVSIPQKSTDELITLYSRNIPFSWFSIHWPIFEMQINVFSKRGASILRLHAEPARTFLLIAACSLVLVFLTTFLFAGFAEAFVAFCCCLAGMIAWYQIAIRRGFSRIKQSLLEA